MIDSDGYRSNVGILLINDDNQVFLAKRYGEDAWQLPQGGIDKDEDEVDALYRELYEEVGLGKDDVIVIAKTPKWLRYRLPKGVNNNSNFVGQKQIWFLLKINCPDEKIKLDGFDEIEFDNYSWVDYWRPVDEVISFKKAVYEDMLKAFAPVVFNNNHIVPKHLTRSLSCSAITLNLS